MKNKLRIKSSQVKFKYYQLHVLQTGYTRWYHPSRNHRHDVTKVSDFYNGGLWGKSVFCRIQLKYLFWLYKKRRDTTYKFQLEKNNKNVIAKKPLTNLYETYSRVKAHTLFILDAVIMAAIFSFNIAVTSGHCH